MRFNIKIVQKMGAGVLVPVPVRTGTYGTEISGTSTLPTLLLNEYTRKCFKILKNLPLTKTIIL